MTTTATVATTIRHQIGWQPLASLGASTLAYGTHNDQPGLTFKARILPFNKDGARAERPRVMRVWITLTPADLYNISVGYEARNGAWATHHEAEGIYADDLPRHLLALDYDGPTALNPRLAN